MKTQGEQKFEKSLYRSVTSFHRRESEDISRALDNGSPVSKAGLKGRREVPQELIIGTKRQEDDDEGTVLTPTVARRNGY